MIPEIRNLENIFPDYDSKRAAYADESKGISTIYNPKLGQGAYLSHSIPISIPNNLTSEKEHCKTEIRVKKFVKIPTKIVTWSFWADTLCASLFLFATLILLIVLGYVLYAKSETITNDNSSDMFFIDGEFQVVNLSYNEFDYEMADTTSAKFRVIASEMSSQLNALFRRSKISRYYAGNVINQITPNGTVRFTLHFVNDPRLIFNAIVSALVDDMNYNSPFHSAGYLGGYKINMTAIGLYPHFENSGVWSNWSDWSECNENSMIRRTRNCLNSNNEDVPIIRCLYIPERFKNVEIKSCNR